MDKTIYGFFATIVLIGILLLWFNWKIALTVFLVIVFLNAIEGVKE